VYDDPEMATDPEMHEWVEWAKEGEVLIGRLQKQWREILKPWIDFREGEVGDCPEMDELLDKIVVLGGQSARAHAWDLNP